MAKDDGFIKVSRQLNNWEHADNLAMIGFWIRLLLLADWEDVGSRKRGEFLTTAPVLAGICNCSEATVWRYLKKLKESGEITLSTNHRRTRIRILNYDRYQSNQYDKTADKTDGQSYQIDKTADKTDDKTADKTDGQSLTLSNKRKELKKVRSSSSREKPAPPTPAEVKEYAESIGYEIDADYFWDYYNEVGWTKKNGQPIKDWKSTLRNWKRSEKKKEDKEQNEIAEQFAEYLEPSGANRDPDWLDE